MSGRAATRLPARLLLVLEPAQARPDDLVPLLDAGARWLWIRAKRLGPASAEALVRSLLPLLHGATLSLGGHPEVAAAWGLACHLPRDGEIGRARRLAPVLLGVSCHDAAEVRAAASAGADYVTLSPIYQPISKALAGRPLGPDSLREVARSVAVPVLALGGVTPENIPDCLRAGAAGVAVAGGVTGAADPAAALRAYQRALEAGA